MNYSKDYDSHGIDLILKQFKDVYLLEGPIMMII